MLRRLFLLVLLILSTSFLHLITAQGTLIFCDSVTNSGQAIGVMQSLIMDPGGQTVKMLYKSDSGKLNTRKLRITFYKLHKSAFTKFDEISFFSDPTQEGIVTDFKIKSSGDYRIRYYDYDNKLLADEVISVSDAMQESEGYHETDAVALAPDSLHTTQVLFSDGLLDEKTDLNTEFPFRGTRGKIYLYIEPFESSTPERIVDIWKKEGSEYSRFITSGQFTFIRDNNRGYAIVTFPEAAAFKVSLYTTDNILITTSFVEFK